VLSGWWNRNSWSIICLSNRATNVTNCERAFLPKLCAKPDSNSDRRTTACNSCASWELRWPAAEEMRGKGQIHGLWHSGKPNCFAESCCQQHQLDWGIISAGSGTYHMVSAFLLIELLRSTDHWRCTEDAPVCIPPPSLAHFSLWVQTQCTTFTFSIHSFLIFQSSAETGTAAHKTKTACPRPVLLLRTLQVFVSFGPGSPTVVYSNLAKAALTSKVSSICERLRAMCRCWSACVDQGRSCCAQTKRCYVLPVATCDSPGGFII